MIVFFLKLFLFQHTYTPFMHRIIGLLVFFNCFSFSILQSQEFDIIIHSGKIVDGTGNPWMKADIGIINDKIIAIGILDHTKAKTLINATDKIVSPGFVDIHAHVEGSLSNRPEALNFIHDGVTSIVTGNCGGSKPDLKSYFEDLEALGLALNVGSLAGHNTARRLIMGNDDRDPTDEDLQLMIKFMQKAMDDGALGMSTGLIYLPGSFSKTEEIVALAQVTKDAGGVYVSHIRHEDHRVFEAIEEAAEIGLQTGIPVQISHFKVSGKSNWGASQQTLDLVMDYRKLGLDITIDQYPYTASSTRLATLIPEWAREGTDEERRVRLKKKKTRKKIKAEMKEMIAKSGFENYSYAYIAFCPWDQAINGMNISEIAIKQGKKGSLEDEMETILDLLKPVKRVQMVYHKMSEEDVTRIMSFPYGMIASDAGIVTYDIGSPHPRAYGTNARVLAKYVREEGAIHLEDAIRKMTSFPAQKFHLDKRGLLREGYFADITIFDEFKIQDKATFEAPHAYSEGISHVIVNGVLILNEGVFQENYPGKILKRN